VEVVLDVVKRKEEVAVKNAGEILVNVRGVSNCLVDYVRHDLTNSLCSSCLIRETSGL
jgi:hypothetical protein